MPCGIPLIDQSAAYGTRTAVISAGKSRTYEDLLTASAGVASGLLQGKKTLQGSRVAFLTQRGFEYPVVQWGIWRAGGVAVPLCDVHPVAEWLYVLRDSGASAIVAQGPFLEGLGPVAQETGLPLWDLEVLWKTPAVLLPSLSPTQGAMIIYTSGTTGKPKGVVLTHANIEAQIRSLVEAWGWSPEDRILNILPLHHVHGIVNVLCCAFWVGAQCLMMPRFDALAVWEAFQKQDLTLFMAVPTVYVKLLGAWEAFDARQRQTTAEACQGIRLMVSGSAALPVSIFEKWKAATGHTLLERYGMTEIGMALSNPLHGERKPGTVGMPLPGVTLRLVDEEGKLAQEGEPGEIQVRGPGVFREYWERPLETQEAFVEDWFRTGDVAVLDQGYYRIQGRQGTDILKTGGYKVSALEIEEVLRTHPDVKECAVVGIPDLEWGERVCVALIVRHGANLAIPPFRAWARERLAPYKVPSRFLITDDLPRNPMGKVTKPAVKNLFLDSITD